MWRDDVCMCLNVLNLHATVPGAKIPELEKI